MPPGPLRPAFAGAVLALALLALACDGGGGGSATATRPASSPTLPAGPQATPTTAPAASPSPQVRVGDERVAFQTDDGIVIRGHLYEPTGPRRKVAIFAHMLPNDQRAWTAFAQEMAGRGIAALTFDFRGHGETGGARDVSRIDRDLEAAVLFMKSRDYPQVYIVGASMGGTAAIKVAARQDLAGIVIVSAPIEIMGLSARNDIRNVAEPKMFIASRDDPEGAAAALEFFRASAPPPVETVLYDGRAHGTQLLDGGTGAQFRAQVTSFISR